MIAYYNVTTLLLSLYPRKNSNINGGRPPGGVWVGEYKEATQLKHKHTTFPMAAPAQNRESVSSQQAVVGCGHIVYLHVYRALCDIGVL